MISFFIIWCQPICQHLLSNAWFFNTSHSWPPNKPCRWSRWSHKDLREGWDGRRDQRSTLEKFWKIQLTHLPSMKMMKVCVFHGQRVAITRKWLLTIGFPSLSSNIVTTRMFIYVSTLHPFPCHCLSMIFPNTPWVDPFPVTVRVHPNLSSLRRWCPPCSFGTWEPRNRDTSLQRVGFLIQIVDKIREEN